MVLKPGIKIENLRHYEYMLSHFGNYDITIDFNKVENVLDKIAELPDNITKTGYINATYCKKAIKYLCKIKDTFSDKDNLIIKHRLDNKEEVITTPIDFEKYPKVEVSTMLFYGKEYEEYHKIRIDFLELMNALAFEIAHNDFGFSLRRIEHALKEVGIIATYDSKLLYGALKDINYHDLYVMQASDSDYKNYNNLWKNYYGTPVGISKNYKEVMKSTSIQTMNLLTYEILNNALKNNIDLKLCGVYGSSLDIMIKISKDDVIADVMDKIICCPTAIIKGRKFKFKPKLFIQEFGKEK